VDLLPTLLDTAGLPVPANLHGRSLRSLRPDDPQRVVISESFTDSRQTRMAGRTFRAQRALYRGPWKLIFEPGGKQNGGEQLYHWQSDPAEEKNLYATESQIAASLTSEIQQWIQAAPRRKSVTQKMDRQTMERLRGLGYVQ
jgi:arylsulfatase A-like enzyme